MGLWRVQFEKSSGWQQGLGVVVGSSKGEVSGEPAETLEKGSRAGFWCDPTAAHRSSAGVAFASRGGAGRPWSGELLPVGLVDVEAGIVIDPFVIIPVTRGGGEQGRVVGEGGSRWPSIDAEAEAGLRRAASRCQRRWGGRLTQVL